MVVGLDGSALDEGLFEDRPGSWRGGGHGRADVEVRTWTASEVVWVGWGQCRWRDRFTCQRVYLRFTTRGLARGRRSGRMRVISSRMA